MRPSTSPLPARESLGLSQKAFAAMLGVSTSTIQSIELGRLKLSDRMRARLEGCGIYSHTLAVATPDTP